MIKQAGGKLVYVPLRLREKTKNKEILTSADLFLDEKELTSKFNSKTKIIVINTPTNPHVRPIEFEARKTVRLALYQSRSLDQPDSHDRAKCSLGTSSSSSVTCASSTM